jgi:hypothetical protein
LPKHGTYPAAVSDWLGDLLQPLLSRLWMRRASQRRAGAGLYDCALRRVDRQRPGGWDPGRCRVESGRLTVMKAVLPRGWEERELAVTAVFGSGRSPTAKEAWHVDPSARIFTIDTSEGRYEWAVVAPDADEVASHLRGSG